jgi:methyl-accepting chemotaxis protein
MNTNIAVESGALSPVLGMAYGISEEVRPEIEREPRTARLFGLNLAQTVTIAGMLFLVPTFILFYFFGTGQLAVGDIATLEKRGVEYIQPVYQLQGAIQRSRELWQAALGGDPAAREQAVNQASRVAAAITAVDAVDARLGARLEVSENWRSYKQLWQAAAQAVAQAGLRQNHQIHTKALNALLGFIVDVADKSKLTLDPEVDSYYLMDALTTKLPSINEQIAQLRSRFSAIGVRSSMGPEESRELLQLMNGIDQQQESLLKSLSRAYSVNPSLRNDLERGGIAVSQGTWKQFQAWAQKNLRDPTPDRARIEPSHPALRDYVGAGVRLDFSSSEVLNLLAGAATEHQGLVETIAPALRSLLAARADQAWKKLAWIAGLASLLILLAIGALYSAVRGALTATRALARQARTSSAENQRNQSAILKLLDEMENLADGDLKVQASVSEDITGAIADSVNYAVGELRNLVTGVQKATGQVTQRAREAQATSEQLLEAASLQAKHIEETTTRMGEVTRSIHTVSANAAESTKVAQRSLNTAEKGQAAVQNSIRGMNEIRDQIQETAKRIKRLGESSQQIGEIVELISDITAQTNVLALNAAIQAAAAGDAGRGFTVVAEEVQRLAERSAEATKQIAAIVKVIQTDTQGAVGAMEKSTMGVVEGAKLADAAGQTLSEIGEVSNNLARLIQSISGAAATQVAATERVAQNMERILAITRQTTTGTQQSAHSVKQLTDVAESLSASVSRFKL